MRRKRRIFVLALVGTVGVAWLARSYVWMPVALALETSPPPLAAALRSSAEHDARTKALGRRPYFIEAEGLLVAGCRHSNDPEDATLTEVEARMREFQPDVVLIEGRTGWHVGNRTSLVRRFGESGLARALAWDASIPCRSLEPNFALEVRDAVSEFGKQKTLAFYTLRVFISERDSGVIPAEAVDREASHLLAKRAARTGIEDAISGLSEFDAFWSREFPHGPDWRVLPANALWRTRDGTWLGRIAERINDFVIDRWSRRSLRRRSAANACSRSAGAVTCCSSSQRCAKHSRLVEAFHARGEVPRAVTLRRAI